MSLTTAQRRFKKLTVAYEKLPETLKGMESQQGTTYTHYLHNQFKKFVYDQNVSSLSKMELAKMCIIMDRHQPMPPASFIKRIATIYKEHYKNDVM